jgi:hypothetical protein
MARLPTCRLAALPACPTRHLPQGATADSTTQMQTAVPDLETSPHVLQEHRSSLHSSCHTTVPYTPAILRHYNTLRTALP